MSDKTELNLDAERASFKELMRAAGWGIEHFELVSVSEGESYRSSHMEGAWSCWLALAARRATIQPTAAEPVAWMCPNDPDVASAFKWAVKGVDYSGLSCACGEKHVAVFSVAPADAVRDAERLDFMSTHGAWVAWNREGERCRVFHHNGEDGSEPIMGWVPEAWADTAREAIDAAMKFSTPKEPAK